jgi:signal transduction histidine kinase
MKCPRCQQDNPAEQKFCGDCGTPLAGASQARPYADLKDENEGLRRSLTESREQQTATSEILRVISGAHTDAQPVFDSIVRSAARLLGGYSANVLERKIRQVVLNLLSNAIKFTPEGGRIEVRAAPSNGAVEVSVSDTGVGIAPEDQEAIFEEFRQVGTAAKEVEGTGLGLALSRKFIELHGGRIWVESEVGAGSTFTFTIPPSVLARADQVIDP